MVRIAGINLQDKKRIDYALTKIYGIGWSNVGQILKAANIESSRRTDGITEEEANRLQKTIETYKIEGDLRRENQGNIKRLKEIGSYRGIRHIRNLPVRGQRTRSNARTKRGKRVTIGALKKEAVTKMGIKTQTGAKMEETKGVKSGS